MYKVKALGFYMFSTILHIQLTHFKFIKIQSSLYGIWCTDLLLLNIV